MLVGLNGGLVGFHQETDEDPSACFRSGWQPCNHEDLCWIYMGEVGLYKSDVEFMVDIR